MAALDNDTSSLTTCSAQRNQHPIAAATSELIQRRTDQHVPGGTQRVPHSDRTAVHVHYLWVDAVSLKKPQDYRGEGFVQFPHIDVLYGEAGPGK